MSFFTQESICIQHERRGDIYCYNECQLNEIEATLGIENERPKRVDTDMSFFTQESICIQHERRGDIYCYNECQLNEIEAYLMKHQIPYYVRSLGDCWGVKYDRKG